MATKLTIKKVLDSLPGVLDPNTIYYVLDSKTNVVTTYITDLSGNTAYPMASTTDQITPQHMYAYYPLDVLNFIYPISHGVYDYGLLLADQLQY